MPCALITLPVSSPHTAQNCLVGILYGGGQRTLVMGMEYSHDQAASTSKWLSKSMFLSLAQNKQVRRQALALWRSNKLLKSALLCLKKKNVGVFMELTLSHTIKTSGLAYLLNAHIGESHPNYNLDVTSYMSKCPGEVQYVQLSSCMYWQI